LKHRVSLLGATAIAAVMAHAPRLALVLADVVARCTLRAGRRRAPRNLDGRALRRFWSNHVRHIVLSFCATRYGTRPLQGLLLPSPELDALRPPCVIVTFHAGPIQAFSAALERLGRALVLRQVDPSHPRDITLLHTIGGDRGALGVVHGVRWLRDGGFVFVAIDPSAPASRVDVPFQGRTLRLARGAFAMARIASVPLVPVVTRWRGSQIELVFGESLSGSDEQQLAAHVTRWFENYLAENPGEISQRTLSLVS